MQRGSLCDARHSKWSMVHLAATRSDLAFATSSISAIVPRTQLVPLQNYQCIRNSFENPPASVADPPVRVTAELAENAAVLDCVMVGPAASVKRVTFTAGKAYAIPANIVVGVPIGRKWVGITYFLL